MFAICVESSHTKGMGHFFRVLNIIEFLQSKKEQFIVFINNNPVSISKLKQKNINYEIVDLFDFDSDWESSLIKKYSISIWLNDRLDTDVRHVENVIKNSVKLITFDDRGSGAELCDLNICGLEFNKNNNLKGKKALSGIKYLILNKEIEKFKRIRSTKTNNILVTLGGSDTHAVTVKIVKILKRMNKKATVIVGPSFEHIVELEEVCDNNFSIKKSVPSLIKEFYDYDLAITGGGITPFEANASGLPCIIIASEHHEISNAKYLESIESSYFAGYFKQLDENIFTKTFDINYMSKKGIDVIKTDGIENIFYEINSLN